MEILHLSNGQPVRRLDTLDRLPDEGLVWVDFLRDDCQHWECWAEPIVGAAIDVKHVSDSHNVNHASFFDGTADYDMLLFAGLGPSEDPLPLVTRTVAFFLFDRVLITVRSRDNISIDLAKQKLLDARSKPPGSVLLLAHLVLDTMVDRFLNIREPLNQHFTCMQDELLGHSRSGDWHALLEGRRVARQLEALSEDQIEALDAWRRGSRFDWNSAEEVRIRDLGEHVKRVLDYTNEQERDIEAAVQLHFASLTHRTNEIMRVFTVVSVVFMPMMLITSIWGMNFEYMPELHWRYGYFIGLGVMALVGVGCWLYFKIRRFL